MPILNLVLGTLGAACWLTAVINCGLMIRHRQPGVPLFPRESLRSPFIAGYRDDQLTEAGRRARLRMFYATLGFMCVVGVLALAAIIRSAR